jgi:hypothetical protein
MSGMNIIAVATLGLNELISGRLCYSQVWPEIEAARVVRSSSAASWKLVCRKPCVCNPRGDLCAVQICGGLNHQLRERSCSMLGDYMAAW